MRFAATIGILGLLATGAIAASAQDRMIYSDFGASPGVHTVERTGVDQVTILEHADLGAGMDNEAAWIQYIAVDPIAQKIYLSELYGGNELGRIERYNFDGSGGEVVVALGSYRPGGIVLDLDNQQLYWISAEFGILRENFDGSDPQIIVGPSHGDFYGLAAHFDDGYLFWIDGSDIKRANLDGSDIQTIVDEAFGDPYDIVVNPIIERIYWSDLVAIRSARFDGSDVQTLYTPQYPGVSDIEVDLATNTIYWSPFGAVCSVGLYGNDPVCPLPIFSPGPVLAFALDTGLEDPALPTAGKWAMTACVALFIAAGGYLARRKLTRG